MSKPPETDKQRKERMKKEVPATPKPGKVLTFPESILVRLCKECHHGSMEELNFHGMENILKCCTCGALVDLSK